MSKLDQVITSPYKKILVVSEKTNESTDNSCALCNAKLTLANTHKLTFYSSAEKAETMLVRVIGNRGKDSTTISFQTQNATNDNIFSDIKLDSSIQASNCILNNKNPEYFDESCKNIIRAKLPEGFAFYNSTVGHSKV